MMALWLPRSLFYIPKCSTPSQSDCTMPRTAPPDPHELIRQSEEVIRTSHELIAQMKELLKRSRELLELPQAERPH
jgi:hypothetical protein